MLEGKFTRMYAFLRNSLSSTVRKSQYRDNYIVLKLVEAESVQLMIALGDS